MQAWWTSLIFLVGVYWPFMLVAGAIGLFTGWLSLSRSGSRR